jgi:2-oxopent-4-enoate hydratase
VSAPASVIEAADRLAAAVASGVPCPPVNDLIATPEEAYATQELATERRLARGARLVGRKIGLTSAAVQRQLGVDQPDYGMLFADMAVDEGADVPLGRLLQPKVEAEIAFVLQRDLPHLDTTVADTLRAIDFAVVAIEIVDSRIADWAISFVDTVADNASSGLFVLGSTPVPLHRFDPVMCGMVMERRGEPISVGAGKACLGSPLRAATWLARTMAAVGRPLAAGDTILSGALGPMATVAPGDVVEARVSGLGSVTASFAAAADARGAA